MRYAPRLSDERGIALAVAIFALVIIGALVAGTFFAGRLEQRSGLNTLFAAQAAEAAEAGTAMAQEDWVSAKMAARPLTTDTVVALNAALGGGAFYTTTVSRLSASTFLIRSEGQRQSPNGLVLSRRLVGQVVRIIVPTIDIQGALTLQGSLTLSGTAEISGADHIPTGWGGSCGAVADSVAGIRSNSNDVTTNGANCSGLNCVSGSPQLLVDTTVNNSTFTDFGSTTFDELAAAANIVLGSGTYNGIAPDSSLVPVGSPLGTRGACRVSNNRNWGEPYTGVGTYTQCFDYFPIIYATGNVKINGGRGQGILLIDGDLELAGGVEFYGPVIATGRVRSAGTGGHVYGGVMAQNVELDPNVITGNSVINYSACAVQRALLGAGTVRPIAERSWAQLY
jgi:hypothetical protein